MPTKKTTTKKKVTKKVAKQAAVKKTTKSTKATKAAKKTTAKKPAKKSSSTKPELVIAMPEQAFWVNNGAVLHSLVDLADELSVIGDEVFSHHVNSDRHDFAEWVEHVLQDTACAAALRKTMVPKKAQTIVITHLKRYSV